MKILHISDTHFSDTRLSEKERCFNRILDRLGELRPDIAVHTGDMFDHGLRLEDPGAQVGVKLMSRLADVCPIIFIKGNFSHDRNSVEILEYVRGRHKVYVSTEPEIIVYRDGAPVGISLQTAAKGIVNVGDAPVFFTLPYPSSSFLAKTQRLGPEALRQAVSDAITDVIRAFAAVSAVSGELDPLPRVLLFHGTVAGAKMTESQHTMGMDIELRPTDIEACGFDLVCAGHLHYKQQIGRNVFYTGGLCHTTFADEGEKGAWFYELNGHQLQFNFIPVPAIRMRTFDIDMTESPFIMPPAWAEDDCELKIRIKVREDETHLVKAIDFKGLFPRARSIAIQRIVEPVRAVRCDAVRAAKTLRDKVKTYCEYAGIAVTKALLAKADLLESVDPAALEAFVKENLTPSSQEASDAPDGGHYPFRYPAG